MSHTCILLKQNYWNNQFEAWKLPLYFSTPVLHHIKHFVDGMLSTSFTGTLTDGSLQERDRRTRSHFLTHGNWDALYLKRVIQRVAFQQIQACASETVAPCLSFWMTPYVKNQAFVIGHTPDSRGLVSAFSSQGLACLWACCGSNATPLG